MTLAKFDGTSLDEHRQDCLDVFIQLKESLPKLSEICQNDYFWENLFYAICFHDIGKVHSEFQKYLQKMQNKWSNQRHEIYSVAFANKLILEKDILERIQRAILAHHKNFNELKMLYKSPNELKEDMEIIYTNRVFHPQDFKQNLKRYFPPELLREEFRFIEESAKRLKISLKLRQINYNDIPNPIESLVLKYEEKSAGSLDYFNELMLWGALKICDHYGSAKVKEIYRLNPSNFAFLDRLNQQNSDSKKSLYHHQKKCWETKSNCILIAPTGTGKTEAAIGWIRNQMQKGEGRVYYILPYTASINAMHQRLIQNMEGIQQYNKTKVVGVQHGKLSQYIAILNESEDNHTLGKEKLNMLRTQFKQMIYPLKVITPFQILKYFFGVKGFEMGFVQLCGAYIIFDEIHAYDTITFAQILVMLEYGIRYMGFQVMVMTATLPSFMLHLLKNTLGVEQEIRADSSLLDNLKRHRIVIQEGTIFDQIHLIEEYLYNGKRVIVVCNTVRQAQNLYLKLIQQNILKKEETVLLHSRFNAFDRISKENNIGSSVTRLLVGTQAIEVSLDIDYDVMVTEPAPLDALIQRFGRVNRRNLSSYPCPIFICKNGGESDHLIYPLEIVKKTIEVLSGYDIINETDVQVMLDQVYPSWSKKELVEFNDTVNLFRESIKSLQPYSGFKEREEEFYSRFDSIEVLPSGFYDEYCKLIKEWNFIQAEQLKVSIGKGIYCHLKNNNQIELIPIDLVDTSGDIHREMVLIAKCHYDHELGMTDDFEEIQTYQGFI